MDLSGKTILITGSTDGVGRMVAERLAADGAHVLVHGRDAKRGEPAKRRAQCVRDLVVDLLVVANRRKPNRGARDVGALAGIRRC